MHEMHKSILRDELFAVVGSSLMQFAELGASTNSVFKVFNSN